MSKLLSRKFWLMMITYVVFIGFFALGKLPVNWFCGSLLAISAFYFIANVWEKQINTLTIEQIIDIVKDIRDK